MTVKEFKRLSYSWGDGTFAINILVFRFLCCIYRKQFHLKGGIRIEAIP